MADRLGAHGSLRVLAAGIALFAVAYLAFAVGPVGWLLLALPFIAAGVAIGCVETAEHAAVATLAPTQLRGSAFGPRRRPEPRQLCGQRRRRPAVDPRIARRSLRLYRRLDGARPRRPAHGPASRRGRSISPGDKRPQAKLAVILMP